tara:strand:- start:133 stop:1107 length:975 start_codon:yes stop_codon:yes gene_type:complete
LIILLFAIGLPDFFKPKKIPMPQVIPIEILNVSDVTSLTSKKENIEINKESKKIEQKKFTSSENTEIQKIDLNEKTKKKVNTNEKKINDTEMINKPESKNITLKKKEINNLIEEKKLNVESVETLKVNKIKPKLKPKAPEQIKAISDVVIENKTKPEIKKDTKIIDKPKPVSKPEPDFNLATMLKDLRNEDISNTSNNNNNEEDKIEQDNENENKANIEVSISEMDLVLQQLRSCFNPRAGTQIIGDEMVKISAKIDREANVRKDTVQILATNISKSNPYYEAITESAVATLYNPLCSKLKLPLDKYESWKDLKITIDYSWIKN